MPAITISTKPSTALPTVKTNRLCVLGGVLLLLLAAASLFIGKYPLSLRLLLHGDDMQMRVFLTLRLSRVLVGLIGGFSLGICGFVFQTVFRNPLASPDIIGVSSGASTGAAVGILFLSHFTALSASAAVTGCAFLGALIAVLAAIGLSILDRSGKNSTIVLAGIAVHALAQTALMCLKLTADPERELASIEYWMMGSLNGITLAESGGNLLLCVICTVFLFLLYRQILLLSADEGEARMLGMSVGILRLVILLTATLSVAAVISQTGLISFIGLLAPHIARLLSGDNRRSTMLLGGICGGILLLAADIFARTAATAELPVSIFTSLIGAPFLIRLIVRGGRTA